jgi:hypothetical protein
MDSALGKEPNLLSLLLSAASNPLTALVNPLLNPNLATLLLLSKLQNSVIPNNSLSTLLQSLTTKDNITTQTKEETKDTTTSSHVIPTINSKIEFIPETQPKSNFVNKNKSTKAHVTDIVEFVLEHIGRISETELEKEKQNYSFDATLTQIFDLLLSKYTSTIKTKEEMIKYVIRRAFKALKNKIKKEKSVDSRTACKEICEKYFHRTREDLEKMGVNVDDEDEFFNALLPFR